MATGWIPVGVSTPRCTEVVRIASKAKKSRRETFAALVEFWIWVSQESDNGFLEGYTLETLADVVEGTGGPFWQAVAAEGWVVVADDGLQVPDNKEHQFISKGGRSRLLKAGRQGRWKESQTSAEAPPQAPPEASLVAPTAARPTETVTETDSLSESTTNIRYSSTSNGKKPLMRAADILEISEEEIWQNAALASSLFKRCKYNGPDGAIFWKVGVLVKRAIVAEAWAHDAAEKASTNATRSRVGFFRRTLKATCESHGVDLDFQIARLKLPSDHPCGPPQNGFSAELREMAAGIGKGLK